MNTKQIRQQIKDSFVEPADPQPKGEPKMTIQDCRMIIDIPKNELCSMWDKAFDTKDHNTCDKIDEELERRLREYFFDTRKEVIENETDQSNRSS